MVERGLGDIGTSAAVPSRRDRMGSALQSSPRLITEDRGGEEQFLVALGLSKPLVASMQARAARNGTTTEAEMLASGQVREDAYYAAFARALGLDFIERIDPASVTDVPDLDSQLRKPTALRLNPADGTPRTLVVPQARQAEALRRRIGEAVDLRSAIGITTPSAMREAVWRTGATRRVDASADRLFDERPDLSARSVLTGGQGFLAGFLLTAYLCCLLLFPIATMSASHVGLTAVFCILITLRALAISKSPSVRRPAPLAADDVLPVYTVLVALYRETEVVKQLANSLLRLDWPHSRLDIKLVCEADDRETIDAIRVLDLPPHFELVRVPDRAPRTKPKALNYGLAGARGDYIVIYDAEDRPHRHQLREAYEHFRSAPPEVACLQAPLIIANASESWLSGQFALEYAGLFRRLLPFLGGRHHPMPLGGTSNHFRGLM